MNRMQQQKSGLLFLGIALLVAAIIAIAGGLVLLIPAIAGTNMVVGYIFGILLLIVGFGVMALAIYWIWIASAVKATKGTISDDNLAKQKGNSKVCPNCGCKNTVDSTTCQNCGEQLN